MDLNKGENHQYKNPWRTKTYNASPPRPWFYAKILSFLILILVALGGLFFVFQNYAPKALFVIPVLICLMILLAAFRLRRMFRPLRLLMKGVEEISNGHLDFQFPSFGNGEFQFLAENFNRMAKRVKEMMQAKDQLLTDVSHELRSPLTRMRIALEMTPEGKVRDSMTRAVVEMETMLNELLETQRLRSGHGKLSLGPLDLNRLSQEMVEKYKDRDPGLMFSKSSPSCVVTADEGRIRTVFQNIIENALKYSGEQKKAVILAVEEAMESTIVTFIDYGPGIPKEEQEKVFEPFYRVDKSRTKETGGYGLGLSLCLEIMKAHGGDIKLESEVGQGTKVSLFFKR